MSNPDTMKEDRIKQFIRSNLHVDLVGICSALPDIRDKENLTEFIKKGYQGEMKYLEDINTRTAPDKILPEARSVIMIGINYYRHKEEVPPDHGNIARYAWGRDYHKVMKKLLRQIESFLNEEWPGFEHRSCVDSAPIMEKSYAERAGLGFCGKNSLLINPEIGSFFLIGEVLTTMALAPDAPREGTCGTCRRCMDACPTGALIAPRQIDARRCLSYLTIETRNPIPQEFAYSAGNMIMGCDICQEVCPYNIQLAKETSCPAMSEKKIAGDSLSLAEILHIKTDEQYLNQFAGSPLMRLKRQGLIKNAINAATNVCLRNTQAQKTFLPILDEIAKNDSSQNLRNIAIAALKTIESSEPGKAFQ